MNPEFIAWLCSLASAGLLGFGVGQLVEFRRERKREKQWRSLQAGGASTKRDGGP